MGTVINTNVTALNSHRSMKIVGENTQKASEKLSSGMRINRAGDDAAGLAISEKMRSQIRGLNQASRNSQDGISLIQTAEGALQETEEMLQRMRELVNQAANDTNEASDRDKIALELDQLSKEIDATAEKTEFNKKQLIDGSWEAKQLYLQVGANELQNISFGIEGMNASRLGVTMNEIGTVVRNANVDTNQSSVQGSFSKVATGAAAANGLGSNTTAAASAAGLGGVSLASQQTGVGSAASNAAGIGGSPASQNAYGGTTNNSISPYGVGTTMAGAAVAAGKATEASKEGPLGDLTPPALGSEQTGVGNSQASLVGSMGGTQASQEAGMGGSQASQRPALGNPIVASAASTQTSLGDGGIGNDGEMHLAGGTLKFNSDGSLTVTGTITELGLSSSSSSTLSANDARASLSDKQFLLKDGTYVRFNSTGDSYQTSDAIKNPTLSTVQNATLSDKTNAAIVASADVEGLASDYTIEIKSGFEVVLDTKGASPATKWTDLETGTEYASLDDLTTGLNKALSGAFAAAATGTTATFKLLDNKGNYLQIHFKQGATANGTDATIELSRIAEADFNAALTAEVSTQQTTPTPAATPIASLTAANGATLDFGADGKITASNEIISNSGIKVSGEVTFSDLQGLVVELNGGGFAVFSDVDGKSYKVVDSASIAGASSVQKTDNAVGSGVTLVTDEALGIGDYTYTTTIDSGPTTYDGTIKIEGSFAQNLFDVTTGATVDLHSAGKTMADLGIDTSGKSLTLADTEGNIIILKNESNKLEIHTSQIADSVSIENLPAGSMNINGGGTLTFNADGTIDAAGVDTTLGIANGTNVGNSLVDKTVRTTDGTLVQFNSDASAYRMMEQSELTDIADAIEANGTALSKSLEGDSSGHLEGISGYRYKIVGDSANTNNSTIEFTAKPTGVDLKNLVNIETGDIVDLSKATTLSEMGIWGTTDSVTLMDQNGNLLKFTSEDDELKIDIVKLDFNDTNSKEILIQEEKATATLKGGDVLKFGIDGTVSRVSVEDGSSVELDLDDLAGKGFELANGDFILFNADGDGYAVATTTEVASISASGDVTYQTNKSYSDVASGEVSITQTKAGASDAGTMMLSGGTVLTFNDDGTIDSSDDIPAFGLTSGSPSHTDIGDNLKGKVLQLADGTAVKFNDEGTGYQTMSKDDVVGSVDTTTAETFTGGINNHLGNGYNLVFNSSGEIKLTGNSAGAATLVNAETGATVNLSANNSLEDLGIGETGASVTLMDQQGRVIKLTNTADGIKTETGELDFSETKEISLIAGTSASEANGTAVLKSGDVLTFNGDGTVTASKTNIDDLNNSSTTLTADDLKNVTLELGDGNFIKFNAKGDTYKIVAAGDKDADYANATGTVTVTPPGGTPIDEFSLAPREGTMKIAGENNFLKFNENGTVTADGPIASLGITGDETDVLDKLKGKTIELADGGVVQFNEKGTAYKTVSGEELENTANSALSLLKASSINGIALGTVPATPGGASEALDTGKGATGYKYTSTAETAVGKGDAKIYLEAGTSGATSWSNATTGETYDSIEDLNAALNNMITAASKTNADDQAALIVDDKGNALKFEVDATTQEVTISTAKDIFKNSAEVSMYEGANINFEADGSFTVTGAMRTTDDEEIKVNADGTVDSKELADKTVELSDGSFIKFNSGGTAYKRSTDDLTDIDYDDITEPETSFRETNAGNMVLAGGETLTFGVDGTVSVSGAVAALGVGEGGGTVGAEDLAGKTLRLGNGNFVQFNDKGDGFAIIDKNDVLQSAADADGETAVANLDLSTANVTTPESLGLDADDTETDPNVYTFAVSSRADTDNISSYSYSASGGKISLTSSDSAIDTENLIDVNNGKSYDLKNGVSLSDLGIDGSNGGSITLMDQKGNLLNFTASSTGELTITAGAVNASSGSQVSMVGKDGTMMVDGGATLTFNADGTVTASGAITGSLTDPITDEDATDGADIKDKLAGQTIQLADGTSVSFNEDATSYTATKVNGDQDTVNMETTAGSMQLAGDAGNLTFGKDGSVTLSANGTDTVMTADELKDKTFELADGNYVRFNETGDSFKVSSDAVSAYEDINENEISLEPSSAGLPKGTMNLDNGSTLKFFSDGSILETKADGKEEEITGQDLADKTFTLEDGKTQVTFNKAGDSYQVDGGEWVAMTQSSSNSGEMKFGSDQSLKFNMDGTVTASGPIDELGITESGTVTAAQLRDKTAQLADGTFVQFNNTGTGYKIAAAPGMTSNTGAIGVSDETSRQQIGSSVFSYSKEAGTNDISFNDVGTGMKNVETGKDISGAKALEDAVNTLKKGQELTIMDDENNLLRFTRDSSNNLIISHDKIDFNSSSTVRIDAAKSNVDDLVALGSFRTLDGGILHFTENGGMSVTGTIKDTSNNQLGAPADGGTVYDLSDSMIDQGKLAGKSILTDKGTITFGSDGKTISLDPNKTSEGLIDSGVHKTRNGSTVETDSTGKVINVTGKVTTHDGKEIGNGASTNVEDLAGKTIRLEDGRYVSFDSNLKATVSDDISNIPNTERNELAEKADKEAAAALESSLSVGEDSPGKKISALLVKIDAAIESVSSQRANLGALQNRLEHTIKNVDTASENLSAAESRIRDTDMAAEMMNFTKSNVLSQAAMSMLAQANQAPNNVLSLLR